MSHFTVLVVGENPEEQLAPYDENLKVEWHDLKDEYRKQYENDVVQEFYCESSSSWGMHIPQEVFDFIKSNPVGSTRTLTVKKGGLSYYKEGCAYRGYYELPNHKRCEGDAWFRVTKIISTSHPDSHICFEGEILIQVIEPPKKIALKDKYPNYEDYLTDWHGVENTEKMGYHRNPNAKWDWYTLGGRWTGKYKVKKKLFLGTSDVVFNELGFSQGEVENLVTMYKSEPSKFEKVVSKYNGKSQTIRESIKKEVEFRESSGQYAQHEIGSPGLMTSPAKEGYADSLLKKYIDVESMRDDAEKNAREKYRKAMTIIGHLPINKSWKEIAKPLDYSDEARTVYRAQPRVVAWNSNKTVVNEEFGFMSSPDDFLMSEEEYVKDARNSAITTFAVVMNGKWYERGEMGWWGVVSDEKDNWADEFNKLFDSIPDDTLLSVYDCHI